MNKIELYPSTFDASLTKMNIISVHSCSAEEKKIMNGWINIVLHMYFAGERERERERERENINLPLYINLIQISPFISLSVCATKTNGE